MALRVVASRRGRAAWRGPSPARRNSVQYEPRVSQHTGPFGLNRQGGFLVTELLFAMATFALIGSITPGPVNVLAVRHGASARWGAAMAYVLGASLSYTLVVWLMGKSSEFLVNDPAIAQAAQWGGAAYLSYLAWRISTAPLVNLQADAAPVQHSALMAFMEGGITQSLNPKAWIVALSGIALFVVPQADGQTAYWLFCGVSLLACCLGVGCWAVAGRVLSRWLGPAPRQKAFNQMMGVLLLLSVASMLR